jgi:hypothetical protein
VLVLHLVSPDFKSIVVEFNVVVALVEVIIAVIVAGSQARRAKGRVGRQRNTRAANAFHIDLTTVVVVVRATPGLMAAAGIVFASHN